MPVKPLSDFLGALLGAVALFAMCESFDWFVIKDLSFYLFFIHNCITVRCEILEFIPQRQRKSHSHIYNEGRAVAAKKRVNQLIANFLALFIYEALFI